MKKILLLLILIASVLTAQTSLVWTDVSDQHTLPGGVKLFEGNRTSPKLIAHYYDVDLSVDSLAVRPYITSNTATVPVLTQRFGAYAAINGGFFGGTTSYSAVVYPGELKAKNVAALTRNGKSYPVTRCLFSQKEDLSFSVDWVYHFGETPQDIYTFENPVDYANNDPTPKPAPLVTDGTKYEDILTGIGGGPLLVKDYIRRVTYNEEIMWGSGVGLDNSDPRTAIGYTADNHVIMMVVDGRSSTSAGLGLTDLAKIMRQLGCVGAINLDGGGSSQMSLGNSYLSIPSSRAVPSIIAITHKDSLYLPEAPTYEEIIDTEDDEVYFEGDGWFYSANAGYYGDSKAALNESGDGSAYSVYKPNLPAQAEYEVYGWWVASSNRCKDTPFTVYHINGETTVKVDQSQAGSSWQFLGKYTFAGDGTDSVVVSDDATGGAGTFVVADAMKFVTYDPSVTFIEEEIPIPTWFSLEQNYPNPFNPETNIVFNLSEDQDIKLTVFDMLGREVAVLAKGFRNAGSYSVNFDASSLTSGVYLYQLTTANSVLTKKMTLLK